MVVLVAGKFSTCKIIFCCHLLNSSAAGYRFHVLRSHGFVIGHVVPEAQEGGPIGLVRDGDEIAIDAEKNTLELVGVSEAELARRREAWVPLELKPKNGTLLKYVRNVADASHG